MWPSAERGRPERQDEMGFLDNLRNRLRPQEDDYDDYYDDYDDRQDSRSSRRRDERETSGVLGNTRRPEAESVPCWPWWTAGRGPR